MTNKNMGLILAAVLVLIWYLLFRKRGAADVRLQLTEPDFEDLEIRDESRTPPWAAWGR